jgi:hypothetical protein
MDTKTSLYISYAVIGLSVCAAAFLALAGWRHIAIAPGPMRILQMLSVCWALGFYAAAVYRRKLAQDAAKQAANRPA